MISLFCLDICSMDRTVLYETELPGLAADLLETYPDQRVFTFEGDLGAGKTTFIKEICRELGVEEEMSSPTFGIVNEYADGFGNPVYHMDCYRLKDDGEAYDSGLNELIDSGAYCFIEWPDKIHNLLPDNFVWVRICVKGKERTFNTGCHDEIK